MILSQNPVSFGEYKERCAWRGYLRNSILRLPSSSLMKSPASRAKLHQLWGKMNLKVESNRRFAVKEGEQKKPESKNLFDFFDFEVKKISFSMKEFYHIFLN
jgi:hypothetical protein